MSREIQLILPRGLCVAPTVTRRFVALVIRIGWTRYKILTRTCVCLLIFIHFNTCWGRDKKGNGSPKVGVPASSILGFGPAIPGQSEALRSRRPNVT